MFGLLSVIVDVAASANCLHHGLLYENVQTWMSPMIHGINLYLPVSTFLKNHLFILVNNFHQYELSKVGNTDDSRNKPIYSVHNIKWSELGLVHLTMLKLTQTSQTRKCPK